MNQVCNIHEQPIAKRINRVFDLAGKMIRRTSVLDWNSCRIEALSEPDGVSCQAG